MRKGNLIVISGPSGAGKGTLVAQLLDRVEDAWVSVSATTRAPRKGEVNGVSYHFLTVEEFEKLIEEDGFLEWAQVHGNYYGTLRSTVEEAMKAGKQVILEIDVQGGAQIRKIVPESHSIFVSPPSLEVLETRLRNRGTETEEVIQTRMSNARVELLQKIEYDIELVNDNLDEALDRLVEIVNNFAEN